MNIQIRGYNFIINDNNSNWLWSTLESWDPYTFNWIEKNKGKHICWDIGAWIGPFTLYSSKLFNKVISFEPDLIAFKSLQNNVNTNNLFNVTLVQEGLFNEETYINFGFIGAKFGDSLSSINHPSPIGNLIKTMTINKAIELYGHPDFLKIDIEGGEEYLIDDLIKFKFNNFCMSNHGPYMKNREQFTDKLNTDLLPFYNCYNIKNEKLEYVPDDGDFYYELKI
jgi:FkbM family methyltransferase